MLTDEFLIRFLSTELRAQVIPSEFIPELGPDGKASLLWRMHPNTPNEVWLGNIKTIRQVALAWFEEQWASSLWVELPPDEPDAPAGMQYIVNPPLSITPRCLLKYDEKFKVHLTEEKYDCRFIALDAGCRSRDLWLGQST